MKRVALVLVVLIAVTLIASGVVVSAPSGRGAAPVPRGQGRANFVEDEVLVSFRPDVSPAVVARSVGARIHGEIEGLGVHVLNVPPGSVEGTVRALTNNPLVEFAEPNGYVQAFVTPNDPSLPNQWAWGKVQAYAAWDSVQGSGTVRVAVVDTGIDVGDPNYIWGPDLTGHEDLVKCQSIIIKSFISGESGNDDNGHGTHVAGTIGACTNNAIGVAGANWAVQLMGVKVLYYDGSGTISAVSNGIKWAADNGAKVINLSLGTSSPYRTLERAVNYAWNKGAVLACAAGNDNSTARTYPAAYTNCIAVAATDQNDARASFSSFGSDWVDVAAPGVNIFSTMQDDFNWCFLCYWYGVPGLYAYLSGTSMATPHVAGLAALIWAKGSCTINSCVRNKIQSTADQISGTARNGTGNSWYWGRVNYYEALK